MQLTCQTAILADLQQLANNDTHSLLIDGPTGCGKTYLAAQYASMLNVPDFQIIEPTVQAIRETIDACNLLDSPIVLCIENLDIGVPAASYTLLKFLEEPSSKVYIVVTCSNLNRLPDTIMSRSASVTACAPIDSDISSYAESKDFAKYYELCKTELWKCIRTFKDVNSVMSMSPIQLNYFEELKSILTFKDSVSNLAWKLSHYNDNSEAPVELVIRYIMEISKNQHIHRCGIECISELSLGRISSHAILSKFLFEAKYCE